MKFVTYLFVCIFQSLFFMNLIFAQSYISEINFVDNEYVEIYSDEFLNLNNSLFFDESGIEKANTLFLLNQVNDSKYYLIGSDNFFQNNNISNLNCSIYSNGKSTLGYYGLKNIGENISIYSNLSISNLNWDKKEDLVFNENESLNYDFNNSNYIISKKSPCLAMIKQEEILVENFSIMLNNLTESNSTQTTLNEVNEINSCDYSFEIITFQDIFTDKIKYKFKTNVSNFFIEYWIEDFGGNILKNKLNTTSISEKSFTPKFSEILVINAFLYENSVNKSNCILNSSKIVYFYSNKKQEEEISKETITLDTKKLENSSYIKVLNQEKIENLTTNILEYEFYRGNSSKRTGYIYFNGKKISSFELEKYSKIKGKITLSDFEKNNSVILSGFDVESKFNFYPPEVIFFDNSSFLSPNVSKSEFEIIDFSLDFVEKEKNLVNFTIVSSLNYDTLCYVNYDRTVVSNILNITNQSDDEKFNLTLNISKIEEKLKKDKIFENETNEILLKLYCKYKKTGLKTYKYYSYDFNYSFEDKNLNMVSDNVKINNLELEGEGGKEGKEINHTNIIQNNAEINFQTFSNLEKQNLIKTQINSIQKTQNLEIQNKNEEVYLSTNEKMKQNSFFSIFLGSITILISLILIW